MKLPGPPLWPIYTDRPRKGPEPLVSWDAEGTLSGNHLHRHPPPFPGRDVAWRDCSTTRPMLSELRPHSGSRPQPSAPGSRGHLHL